MDGERSRKHRRSAHAGNVYERGPDELAMLLKPLEAHRVGFCLDTGHQAAFGTAPLAQWLESLSPFLGTAPPP
jgi:sugar phosphate isomerase/epimerase